MGAEQTHELEISLAVATCNMHMAVTRNDVTQLKIALNSGANPDSPWNNPEQPSAKDGRTALSQAISLNHVQIAEMLVSAGCDVTLVDVASSSTPLFKASYHGRHKFIGLLVQAGAYVNESNVDGETALLVCAKHGFVHNNADSIRALVFYGAHASALDGDGNNCLHLACMYSNLAIVSVCIGVTKELDSLNKEMMTPLYVCVGQMMRVQNMRPNIPFATFRAQIQCALFLTQTGCDHLGLASWLRSRSEFVNYVTRYSCLFDWMQPRCPSDLMHLSRHCIQNQLGMTKANHRHNLHKLDQLDIAEHLKIYLSRRTLTMFSRG